MVSAVEVTMGWIATLRLRLLTSSLTDCYMTHALNLHMTTIMGYQKLILLDATGYW